MQLQCSATLHLDFKESLTVLLLHFVTDIAALFKVIEAHVHVRFISCQIHQARSVGYGEVSLSSVRTTCHTHVPHVNHERIVFPSITLLSRLSKNVAAKDTISIGKTNSFASMIDIVMHEENKIWSRKDTNG